MRERKIYRMCFSLSVGAFFSCTHWSADFSILFSIFIGAVVIIIGASQMLLLLLVFLRVVHLFFVESSRWQRINFYFKHVIRIFFARIVNKCVCPPKHTHVHCSSNLNKNTHLRRRGKNGRMRAREPIEQINIRLSSMHQWIFILKNVPIYCFFFFFFVHFALPKQKKHGSCFSLFSQIGCAASLFVIQHFSSAFVVFLLLLLFLLGCVSNMVWLCPVHTLHT